MTQFLKKYALKFRYAFQGLFRGMIHDRSISLQYIIAIFVIFICMFLHLQTWEWCIILLLIALVIILEYVNSAVEHIVDFICPQYHKEAELVKDYCAASVLVASILSVIIAIIIIGGKIW